MPNMSYCRYENTYRDMVDCLKYMQNEADNAVDESFRKRLLAVIIDFVESGNAENALNPDE